MKYFFRIIIVATYKNAEYEKEFAVVNPFDSSILKKNDEPIRMQVGMKQKLSLSIYFQHKNYNCRGTLKGFILFNYINIPLTFMEVQIVRREVIFGDKKCEPAYVARYELIDGFPTKNERIPIRFFLKSYNLTPTYPNIDNMFCVRYFLNLVIADEEHNRYFKQKEICLFRLYKERKNICNYNGNYNNENEYYNRDEIFITEPIYEEDFSLDYQPAFGGPNNNKQNDNYRDEDDYLDGINPNIPSINEDESYDFGYNISNNDGRNINNNRNERFNDNERFNKNNNFNINNRNNTFNNNRNNTFNNNRNNTFNNNRNNTFDNNRNNIFNNNRNNENDRINNNINNERDNNYKNRIINNNNDDDRNNYNRNRTFNNIKSDNNNIFNDNYIDEEEDNKNINDNYNNRINNRNNNNNYFNENDNNYINSNRNRKNNYNQNRIINKNKIINNNPSNYYSIKTKNNSNTYDESNMFNGDMNDNKNNIINIKSNNYRGNANYINNDIAPIEKKSSHSHRNNLMQTRISSEEDFKNIFDSLDKNLNKEELKKNIFG